MALMPAGELCVRGPTLFSCYWERPKDTEQAFDGYGYFRTGMVATLIHIKALGPHR